MTNFLTIADATAAGAPECFSEEFAYYERHGGMPSAPGAAYFERAELESRDAVDPYADERDEEPLTPEQLAQAQAAHAAAEAARLAQYACPEGDDAACPTATCGCPPF